VCFSRAVSYISMSFTVGIGATFWCGANFSALGLRSQFPPPPIYSLLLSLHPGFLVVLVMLPLSDLIGVDDMT
jgi:hypothetical protein